MFIVSNLKILTLYTQYVWPILKTGDLWVFIIKSCMTLVLYGEKCRCPFRLRRSFILLGVLPAKNLELSFLPGNALKQSKKPCPGSFPFSGTPHPVIYTCKRLDLHTSLLQFGALVLSSTELTEALLQPYHNFFSDTSCFFNSLTGIAMKNTL